MRLLLIDLFRRKHRWMTLTLAASFVPVWWMAAGEDFATQAFLFSMGMTFAFGPQIMAWSLWPRPIWYLPISKRDIWRAVWLHATVGATLITTSAKLMAMLIRMLIPPEEGGVFTLSMLALSSLYDFAFAGVGCALIIVAARPRPVSGPWRVVSAVLKQVAETSLILGMGAAMGGFFMGVRLPVHWSELTARSATWLVAGLSLTIATYFHTVDPAAGSIFLKSKHPGQRATSHPVRAGGLTGIRRLLVHEYVQSTATAAGLVVGFGVLVFVVGGLMQSPEAHGGFLEMQKLLLLDEAMAETRQWVFDLIIWASLFAATQIGRLPNILRHLRVLPLAASLLNTLLVAWPALMVITVWAGLVGLRALASGSQAAPWQPALLVALIGSSAIARAVNLRWLAASPWMAVLGLGAGPLLRLLYGPSSVFLVVLGIGGIAAAAALNHVTLTRSATYRRDPQGFGVSPAGPS
jgi:hypothetical protein